MDNERLSLGREQNWGDIHEEFGRYPGEGFKRCWKRQNFTYEQVKEWKEALGEQFETIDFAFCTWLRDEKYLTVQEIKQQGSAKSLKEKYHKLWTNIHEHFNEWLRQTWEKEGLTYKDAQEWISVGFKPDDSWGIKWWKSYKLTYQEAKSWIEKGLKPNGFEFAYFLKKDGYQPADLNKDNLEELRKKCSWQDIHEYFDNYFSKRKEWGEEQGFNYSETKQLIETGLNPQEISLATYLKQKNIQPQQLTDNLFQLRKEFYHSSAQAYLEQHYPWKERKILQELNLRNLNLEGDLDLEGFWNLEKIYLAGNPHLGEIKNTSYSAKLIYQNPEEWLNLKHPDKEKVEKIVLRNIEFDHSSELIIDKYPNLKIVWKNIPNITKLTISNCPQLEKVGIRKSWSTQELILNNLPNLKELNCSENKLTALKISNCANLQKINCSNNQLTEIKLPSGEKLEELNLYNNNFSQDLSFLSHLVNLKELELGNQNENEDELDQEICNRFYGSLEPLQNMNKLKNLFINDTDIDSGLEYLPDSIEKFTCSGPSDKKKDAKVKIIVEELEKYGGFDSWKLAYKEKDKLNQQLSKPSKTGWKTNLEGIDIAPLVPIILHETFKKGNKLSEKHYLEENDEINYQEIYAKKPHSLNSQDKSLPIKLYNVQTREIETTKGRTDIKNYGIVSYVWGNPNDPKIKTAPKLERDWWKINLTVSGNKTLYKAIQACELWNKTVCKENCGKECQEKCKDAKINHLWMDQLCINQENTDEGLKERNQEVPKMGQYYGNATVTLISIQSQINENKPLTIDIIEKIIQSEWFTRSWTFQEGWLSRNTLFMFDDILVDGRALAADWILYQPAYSEYSRASLGEISEGSVKVATPVGWTYFKDGYDDKDRISLTLSQALRGIKPKERTLSIDGIYSVLGLLPYGEKVKPNYKEWGYKYTQKELLEALYDIMKTAWDNGYGEALGWHGEGFGLIPGISSVGKGSTNMIGGIVVKYKESGGKSEFDSQEVKLNGYEYVIDSIIDELEEVESGRQGLLIDSGLCARNVKIGNEEIKLWGAREALSKVEKNHVLIIPNPKEWESNIPFAILAEKNGETYQRIGLVELRDEDRVKKLQEGGMKGLVISMSDYEKAKLMVKERQTIVLVEPIKDAGKWVQTDLTMEELLTELKQLKKENQELKAQILQPTNPPKLNQN